MFPNKTAYYSPCGWQWDRMSDPSRESTLLQADLGSAVQKTGSRKAFLPELPTSARCNTSTQNASAALLLHCWLPVDALQFPDFGFFFRCFFSSPVTV